MIIINLIIDKSRLCYKINNKILTKRTVFSIILEQNPDQDLRIFYEPRFFSGQNRKKKCANYASKYGITPCSRT